MKTRLKVHMKTSMKLRALTLALSLSAVSSIALAGAYDDLIAAVYRDDTETVLNLVDRGLDVNSVDPAGSTLLHIAARDGNDKLVSELLKRHANPDVRNRVGDTPLMLAAYSGKQGAAELLIGAGAQIDHDGWTALHYAVFAEKPAMVTFLLGKGAKVNAPAPNGQTALMLAAKNGNVEIAKILLQAGADTSLKDQGDQTAAMLAEQNNNTNVLHLIQNAKPVAPIEPKTEAKPAEVSATASTEAAKPATAPASTGTPTAAASK